MDNRTIELKTISLLKTLMMLAVVAYHCFALWLPSGWFNQAPIHQSPILGVLAEYLNYVHIYAFTFASGYLFHYSNFVKNGEYSERRVLRKRFERLLIPYFLVCIFWLIPFEYAYFRVSALDIVNRFFLGTAPRQLWFLLMLFDVNALFLVGIRIENKLKLNWKIVGVSLYIISILGAVLQRVGVPNFFQILTGLRYLIYFFIGYAASKYHLLNKVKEVSVFLLLTCNLGLFGAVYYLNHVYSGLLRFSVIFLTPLLCVSGIFLAYRVACCINNKNANQLFRKIRNNEFAVYLFHQQFIWVTVSWLNIETVHPGIMVLSSFVISFIGSIIVAELVRKIPKAKIILSI